MIAGLAPRARYFDPRLSWRGPFGRTKVRPILLPAKLSCRDNKVPKETLPGRSPREKRAVPCAPHAAGTVLYRMYECRGAHGCARAAATRAIAFGATRSNSARLTAPGCAPVLGELLRGKTDPNPIFINYGGLAVYGMVVC